MTIDIEKMVANEQRKAVKLLQTAIDLGLLLDEYIEVGVNQYSGHTWLMHYDFSFVLYIPIGGDDIWVMTTDNMTGEEFEEQLDIIGYNTDKIEEWARKEVA